MTWGPINSGGVEREKRMWWVVGYEGLPVEAEGLRCTPANPDAWWFPTQGFSVHESQVFETEAEAAERAREKAKAEAQSGLDKLRALG